jgi:hypothetical protein
MEIQSTGLPQSLMQYSVKQACPAVFLMRRVKQNWSVYGHHDGEYVKCGLYKYTCLYMYFYMRIFKYVVYYKNILIIRKFMKMEFTTKALVFVVAYVRQINL